MKTYRLLTIMVLAAWWTGSAAHGQQSGYQPIYPPPSPTGKDGIADRPPEQLVPASGGLSDWIQNKRDCCEGAHGIYTPLYTEIYLMSGPSIPVGGMTLSRELTAGWSITGGARALFFNEPHTQAWVVDAHIINTHQSASTENTQFPILFFQKGIRSDQVLFQGAIGRKTFSLLHANRTMAGLGLGKEWYPWQPADSDGCKWRVGLDGGGRYGSGRIAFREFGHVTDVIGSMYAAAHTDFEFPCRSCILSIGVRIEWAYTFSDILQQTSDVQDLNGFVKVGIRY